MSIGSKPRVQHHEHSRVQFLYHKLKLAGRGGEPTFRLVNDPFRMRDHLEGVEWRDPARAQSPAGFHRRLWGCLAG